MQVGVDAIALQGETDRMTARGVLGSMWHSVVAWINKSDRTWGKFPWCMRTVGLTPAILAGHAVTDHFHLSMFIAGLFIVIGFIFVFYQLMVVVGILVTPTPPRY